MKEETFTTFIPRACGRYHVVLADRSATSEPVRLESATELDGAESRAEK